MNGSNDVSLEFHYSHISREVIYICDVIMALTIVVGITGNVAVGHCILYGKSLRTYINAHLVSSSSANILGCVLLIPLRIYLYSVENHGQNVEYLCDIVLFVRTFCESNQLFMLCFLSYEKYQCVAFPFKTEGRVQRTVVFIVISWTSAFILSVISILVFEDSALYDRCFDDRISFMQHWGHHDAYMVFPLGILSLVVIFIFYGLIIYTLYKHSAKMTKHSVSKKNKVAPIMFQDASDIKHTNEEIATEMAPESFKKSNQVKLNGESRLEKVKDAQIDQKAISFAQDDRNKEELKQNEANFIRTSKQNNKNNKCSKYEEIGLTLLTPGSSSHREMNSISTTATSLTVSISQSLKSTDKILDKKHSSDNKSLQVKAYDIDGTVRTISNEGKNFAGNVCVMNTKNREQGKRRVEVRAAKRIAILIGGFLCCWLPLPLLVVITLASSLHSGALHHLLLLSSTIGTAATAVNPILHALLNRQLKTALIATFKKKLCLCLKKK